MSNNRRHHTLSAPPRPAIISIPDTPLPSRLVEKEWISTAKFVVHAKSTAWGCEPVITKNRTDAFTASESESSGLTGAFSRVLQLQDVGHSPLDRLDAVSNGLAIRILLQSLPVIHE